MKVLRSAFSGKSEIVRKWVVLKLGNRAMISAWSRILSHAMTLKMPMKKYPPNTVSMRSGTTPASWARINLSQDVKKKEFWMVEPETRNASSVSVNTAIT